MREVIPRKWLWPRFGTVCSLWGPTYAKGFLLLFCFCEHLPWVELSSEAAVEGIPYPHPYHLLHFQKH